MRTDRASENPCEPVASQRRSLGCTIPEQCPGVDDECQARTCVMGVCGFELTPEGTPLAAQTVGDCQTAVCDGAGALGSEDDDSDLPDDEIACTEDFCESGAVSHPPVTAGEPCGDDGDEVCNDAGERVECNVAADCGVTTDCRAFACSNETCAFTDAALGTATTSQVPGDCREDQCDGMGAVTLIDNTLSSGAGGVGGSSSANPGLDGASGLLF